MRNITVFVKVRSIDQGYWFIVKMLLRVIQHSACPMLRVGFTDIRTC